MRKRFIFWILTLVLWLPSVSSATPWSYRLDESGVGIFDKMEVFMMSTGSDFATPGLSNFTYSTWNGELVNADYAVATGESTTDTRFDILFASDKTQPLTFDFLAWNGLTLLDRVRVTWSGSNLILSNLSTDMNDQSYTTAGYDRTPLVDSPSNGSPVPEPASMLLLGSGLIIVAGLGKKRLFRKGTV